ncbi:hypothetical protein FOMG_14007 [Fusarium oxysporum f. sp. melonis 26406]|uniref:Uncharacterized protein n=1 Tax=Fusarium oxysporum f. sp. melonis 26406 TaxID=1089452 RepID=W9ZMN6_FUSOX|nr:hypothetical protein FOMG_14007 [Fusarium oxysporum f. sp. melonis 26406]
MAGFFPAALAAPYLSRLLALPGLAVQWLLEARWPQACTAH